MPDLSWNKKVWDGSHDWTHEGEKWSKGWGGSEAQWFGSLYPRLHRFLPAKRVLEIAPGFGRWTRFLVYACDEFVGVDLSAACVQACSERFASASHAKFIQNDGLSLADAGKEFDLIFSFDSLVHAELDVLRSYFPQMVGMLSQHGVGFIHHSNFANAKPEANPHSRATDVRSEDVADLISGAGGAVMRQEVINWGRGSVDLIDCLTLFGRRDAYRATAEPATANSKFMDEQTIIREHISPYSRIERVNGGTMRGGEGDIAVEEAPRARAM